MGNIVFSQKQKDEYLKKLKECRDICQRFTDGEMLKDNLTSNEKKEIAGLFLTVSTIYEIMNVPISEDFWNSKSCWDALKVEDGAGKAELRPNMHYYELNGGVGFIIDRISKSIDTLIPKLLEQSDKPESSQQIFRNGLHCDVPGVISEELRKTKGEQVSEVRTNETTSGWTQGE